QLSAHADLGRPQLVGSTLHLLGGAVELAGEVWSGDTLLVTLDCPGEHEGILVVYVPAEYEYRPAFAGADNSGVMRCGNLLMVPMHLAARAEVALRFSPVV